MSNGFFIALAGNCGHKLVNVFREFFTIQFFVRAVPAEVVVVLAVHFVDKVVYGAVADHSVGHIAETAFVQID